MPLLDEHHHANGKRGLEMLKLSITIVLLGGGAAFTAGKISVGGVEDRLDVHEQVEHSLLTQQAQRTERAAERAAYDAQVARINVEVLLRTMGVTVPRPPPIPEVLRIDAGVKDGGD